MHRVNGIRVRRGGSFAGTALVAMLIASAAIAGASAESARNGKLAYTALLNGLQLYSLAPDTAAVSRLSRSPATELEPRMSPDGTRIAFVSQRDGNWEIYVAQADGSGARRITNDPVPNSDPAWSPDSRQLLFLSDFDFINVVEADGSGLRRLTTAPSFDPAWSPDGTRIAFTQVRNGDKEIFVINPDGTGLARLTTNDDLDENHAWSPDGRRIAFVSDRARTDYYDIYLMNADGTGVSRLTSTEADELFPAWSPDRSRIAYAAFDPNGIGRMFVMNSDGSGVTRLTPNRAGAPAWSPDGTRIAFVFDPNVGDSEIYVVGVAGSGLRQLTRNTYNDFHASWTGDGRILFTSDRAARVVVETANPNGTGRRTIVSSPPSDAEMRARWSPGGTRLAVSSSRDGDAEIYLVSRAGGRLARLTRNSRIDDLDPAWSPDGTEIVFVRSTRDDKPQRLLLMKADGRDVRVLKRGKLCCPDWSADGRRIAFSLGGDIAVIRPDGRGTRVVAKANSEWGPSWAPDSRRLVFGADVFLAAELRVVSANGGRATRLVGGLGGSVASDWSPNGRLIALSADSYLRLGDGSVYVLEADGKNLRRLPLPVPAVAPDWQPRR